MNRRALAIAIVAIVAVVAALAGFKYWRVASMIAAASAFGEPAETVQVAAARPITWQAETSAAGTVVARQYVTLRNELSGTVAAVHFRSGQVVEEGQPLLELDTRTERAELRSAEADIGLARLTVERTRKLVEQKAGTQAEVDRAEAQLTQAEARRDVIATAIARKVMRAPFRGRIGLRDIHPGQYLAEGTELTTLESVADSVYVDFRLPQESAARLAPGRRVKIAGGALAEPAAATVRAIDARADEASRTVRVRAEVEGLGEVLKPGDLRRRHGCRRGAPAGAGRAACRRPARRLRRPRVRDRCRRRGREGPPRPAALRAHGTRGGQRHHHPRRAGARRPRRHRGFLQAAAGLARAGRRRQARRRPPREGLPRHLHQPAGARRGGEPRHPAGRRPGGAEPAGPAVPAHRERRHPGADGVHRCQRRGGARLHHHADRARAGHRVRRGLHRVHQRRQPLHRDRAAQAQRGRQRRPHRDRRAPGPDPRRAAGRGRAAHHPGVPRRPALRDLLHQLQVRQPRSRPGHRIPFPHPAAQPGVTAGRAAGRGGGRHRTRDARLAGSRPHGRAGHRRLGGVGRAPPQQLPFGARPHRGPGRAGRPARQHRPAQCRGVRRPGGSPGRRRNRAAPGHRPRGAGRRGGRGGGPGERRAGRVHGHLDAPRRERAGGGRRPLRQARRDPADAARRHAHAGELRQHGVHAQRAEGHRHDAGRDGGHRGAGGLPVHGFPALGAGAAGGHPHLAGRHRRLHVPARLLAEPADPAGGGALGGPGRGRRHRRGRERAAPRGPRHGPRGGRPGERQAALRAHRSP